MAGQDLEALEQQAAAHPDSAPAFTALAAAYAEADRLDDAAEAFELAAALAPDEVDIQLGLAAVHHARGDDAAVEVAVQRAVELAPDDPGVWLTIYEVSDPVENLNDSIVGAARYLEMVDEADRDETISADLPGLLDAAARRVEAAVAAGSADFESLEWAAELSAILPYVRRALTPPELAPYEGRIRGARARLVAASALAEPPTTLAAGVLAREAALPGAVTALDELRAAAELAPLDAELTGLVATLSTIQAEAKEQIEQGRLNEDTRRLFEAVAEAEGLLAAGDADGAIHGFHEALKQIAELGDDRQPPYDIVAAMAYHGLAYALAEDETAMGRAERLDIALEAADEATARDPRIKPRLRSTIEAELATLRGDAAVDESIPAETEAVADLTPEPDPQPEPEPAMDASSAVGWDAAEPPDLAGEADEAVEPEAVEEMEPEPQAVAEQDVEEEAIEIDAEIEPEPEVLVESPEPIITEIPDLGEPAPRDEPPLDLSLESDVKPVVELAAGSEDWESVTDPSELFQLAQTAYENGAWDQAQAAFGRALETADDREIRALAYAGIAACHHGAGRNGEAQAAVERAVGLDSGCVEAHLVRAELAEDDENWPAVLQAYQFAEAAAPDDPRVHKGLGTVLCRLENWDEAMGSLQKAYATMQDDPEVIFHMGEVFLATGKKDHALACFEDALAHGLQPPQADEVRAFVQAQKDAPPPKPKVKPVAQPTEPLEFDPDTAPPELKRPKTEENLELRERVIRRAVTDLSYDPAEHKKCRLCQAINDKDAEVCQKCGQSFSFQDQRSSGGGGRPCFIATAACGHESAPEVAILRAYRDRCLETRPAGRAFTALYYRLSPPAARFIAGRPGLRQRVRRWLIRPLARAAARRLSVSLEED